MAIFRRAVKTLGSSDGGALSLTFSATEAPSAAVAVAFITYLNGSTPASGFDTTGWTQIDTSNNATHYTIAYTRTLSTAGLTVSLTGSPRKHMLVATYTGVSTTAPSVAHIESGSSNSVSAGSTLSGTTIGDRLLAYGSWGEAAASSTTTPSGVASFTGADAGTGSIDQTASYRSELYTDELSATGTLAQRTFAVSGRSAAPIQLMLVLLRTASAPTGTSSSVPSIRGTRITLSNTSSGGGWGTDSNAVDNSTTTATVWTNAVQSATGSLGVSGFNFQSRMGNDTPDSITSVVATVRSSVSSTTLVSAATVQLYSGLTAIGTAQTLARNTASTATAVTFTGSNAPTWAQLSDLRVVVVYTRSSTSGTTSSTASVFEIVVTVNYVSPRVESTAESVFGAQIPFSSSFVGSGAGGTLGHEFYVSEFLPMTGIKFYRSSSNITGTAVGRLYSVTTATTGVAISGTDVSFVMGSSTTTGWWQASFASPVILQPNVRYRVAVYFPSGRPDYAGYWILNGEGFNGVPSGPITMPSAATATGSIQEQYNVSAGASGLVYPDTGNSQSGNAFLDPMFDRAAGTPTGSFDPIIANECSNPKFYERSMAEFTQTGFASATVIRAYDHVSCLHALSLVGNGAQAYHSMPEVAAGSFTKLRVEFDVSSLGTYADFVRATCYFKDSGGNFVGTAQDLTGIDIPSSSDYTRIVGDFTLPTGVNAVTFAPYAFYGTPPVGQSYRTTQISYRRYNTAPTTQPWQLTGMLPTFI